MSAHLKGHVRDVDQLIVRKREQVEEAQLRERSRLDLFDSVAVDHQLLQRGQSIKGLLDLQITSSHGLYVCVWMCITLILGTCRPYRDKITSPHNIKW